MPHLTLTPTKAYFFTEVFLDDEQLLIKCKRAAQEYVRSPDFKAKSPCDAYFERITTARGCVVVDDELSDEEDMPCGIAADDYGHEELKKEAAEYIKKYKPHLDLSNLHAWKVWSTMMTLNIEKLIDPLLKKRAAKYDRFADSVIKYIVYGELPKDKTENSLIYKFYRLDSEEQKSLTNRIEESLTKKPPHSTLALLKFDFSKDQKAGLEQRANLFLDMFSQQPTAAKRFG